MSSPNVAFNQVQTGGRKPGVYIEFNTRVGSKNLPGNRQRTLIVGQKTASGTLATNKCTDVFSEIDAAILGGYGSQLHRMVSKSLAANPYAVLSVVALDDVGGAVAATWTATFTGTATGGGQYEIWLNDDGIAVNVATSDNATTIAAMFVAAINARRELPFSAASVAGVVTLTAKNKGTVANSFKVSGIGSVPGMTLITAVGVAGASDPSITAALSACFLGGHDQVVSPYRDASNILALRNYLDSLASPYEKRWAVGFVGSNGSLSTATTLSASMNHGWISHAWCRGSLTAPHEIAAGYAAIVAGSEDPAMPLNNLEIKGICAPLIADQTSRTEEENALYNGVTPLAVGPGFKVQIVRAITTYILNDAGAADATLLDLTTPRTLAYVAKVFIADRVIKYSRAKISNSLIASIRDSGIVLLKLLESLGIVEEVDANLPQYIVERDTQDVNRINERIPVDVVNGLHILAERFDLIL